MVVEVLADHLRLDLYRIALSQVVSKYVRETKNNLRHVFDAAEVGGAILLFDRVRRSLASPRLRDEVLDSKNSSN